MFNDEAKKFDPMVAEDKVYTFSNGIVKMANKRFSTLKNDFCITFSKLSEIKPAVDNGSISKVSFEFTKIAELENGYQIKTVDLLCVIIGVGDVEHIKRKTGDQLTKRSYMLADQSDMSISLSIWGEENIAKFTHLQQGQVLAVKCASVGDFGGKSLSFRERTTQIVENYEHAEVQKTR